MIALVIGVLALTVIGVSVAGNSGPRRSARTDVNNNASSVAASKSSPYPVTLKMRTGLFDGGGVNRALPWGTVLPVTQARWITIKSSGPVVEWGVWRKNGEVGVWPVRSTNGGATWKAAGPQLATDWAGGGIYFISKVISIGPSSVVMVSNAVIDVTTDRGRHWYQYLNPASDWIVSAQPVSVSIGIRIRPFPDGNLPKGSYATYVLNSSRHEWFRTALSLGKSS
jgi:hypothetical protein